MELNPTNIGRAGSKVDTKEYSSVWFEHVVWESSVPSGPAEGLSPHLLHDNCHSLGINQKPHTLTLGGQ